MKLKQSFVNEGATFSYQKFFSQLRCREQNAGRPEANFRIVKFHLELFMINKEF